MVGIKRHAAPLQQHHDSCCFKGSGPLARAAANLPGTSTYFQVLSACAISMKALASGSTEEPQKQLAATLPNYF